MKVCFTWYVRLASPAALSCEAAVPGSTIGVRYHVLRVRDGRPTEERPTVTYR